MKLLWEDNFDMLVLQAGTPRGDTYAVLNFERLGCGDGFGARYAAPHSRSERPDWISLGKFRVIEAAQRRCEEHYFGTSYTPLAAARAIGAGKC
jgi:hypothetical protein